MWCFGIIACVLVAEVIGETVYLEDLNNDHDKRNLDFGLPETLTFRLIHGNGVEELGLVENKRLNAIHAPVLVAGDDEYENKRAIQVDLPPNNNVKFYQDRKNGAYFTGECHQQLYGPCIRKLTGNLVINGKEYKLEPTTDQMDTRAFNAHLGTAHTLEALDTRTYITGQTDQNNTLVLSDIDVVLPSQDDRSQQTYDDDEEEYLENEKDILRMLLEKLRNLETRAAPTAHGVEMLLVIDHVIFEKFSRRYPGRNQALYTIREYFSHIVNGVDLRYATIQEEDISIYVTIAGFFVSTKESESPWMNYSKNPTNGLSGLKALQDWRLDTKGLPVHDHASLITGSNIQASGSPGVAGLAYIEGICSYYGVSVYEEKGFFKGSGILAHELGHNLGSPHDNGVDGSGCSKNDDFIMEPSVPSVSASSKHTNPWRFSPCSINKFRKYLNSLGPDSCTLDRGNVNDDGEFKMHTQSLAGQLYSENQQCELLRGVGAKLCSTRDTPEVCRNFQCKSSGSDICYRYVAAHGTPCGQGKMCFEGKCQEIECKGRDCDGESGGTTSSPPETTSMMSTTEGERYVCYDSGVAGYSCRELQKFYGSKKKLCNVFAHECCETCTDRSFCKKETAVNAKEMYTCRQLVDLFGHSDTCRLFTKHCCITCRN